MIQTSEMVTTLAPIWISDTERKPIMVVKPLPIHSKTTNFQHLGKLQIPMTIKTPIMEVLHQGLTLLLFASLTEVGCVLNAKTTILVVESNVIDVVR